LIAKVWIVLGAALGLAFGFSAVFLGSAGIFLKPIAAAFHWSRADIAALPTLGVTGVAIGAPFMGYLADRIGWNKVIAGSVMALSGGFWALSLAPPNRAYVFGCGLLIGGLGAATTPAGYIAVISTAFDRRLGTALGISMMGVGIGVATMPMGAGALVAVVGWRFAYACLGGACLIAGLAAHQLIFRQLRFDHAPGLESMRPLNSDEGISFGDALRGYRFWLIAIVAVVVASTTGGALIHLNAYATDRGMSLAVAARSAGFMGLGVMLSRLGTGLILDRAFAPLVACTVFLLAAAGFYLLTADILNSPRSLAWGALLIGLAGGAEGDLIPFLAKKYFGLRSIGTTYGALMGFFAFGAALGAYVYGLEYDRFRSYIPVLRASAVLVCACGLAITLLGRYRFAGLGNPRFSRSVVPS
jgi:predicted MFS family arabinose efflux permease